MTLKQQKEILEAAIEGRPLEIRSRRWENDPDHAWLDVVAVRFNFADYDFRIKNPAR